MRNRIALAAILLFSATSLLAQRDYEPDLKGYVTNISSPTEIDVDGVHIHIALSAQLVAMTKQNDCKTKESKRTGAKIGMFHDFQGLWMLVELNHRLHTIANKFALLRTLK